MEFGKIFEERGDVGGVVFLRHEDLVFVEGEGKREGGDEFGVPGGDADGDLAAAAEFFGGDGEHFAPGERGGAGDVVGLADGGGLGEGFDEDVGDIADVNGLDAKGVGLAEEAFAEERHEEEGRGFADGPVFEHGGELAAGAVDEGGAEDGEGKAGVMDGLFGGPLGLVVGTGGVGARAEGGHVDVAFHAGGFAGVEDVDGALGVDAVEGLAVFLCDDADEMDGGGAAGGGAFNGSGLVEGADELGGVLDGAGFADECVDAVAVLAEEGEDVRADEAGGAGEEDFGWGSDDHSAQV